MQDYLGNNSLEIRHAEDRHFILQIALKCADISNPCRPWDISRKWSYKVCEEFFRQGDYERRLNLPVTPLCDRHTTSIPKIQVGFFKHVVTPLYVEWHRFLSDGLSMLLMQYLRANQKKWETLNSQEMAEEMETEICEVDANEDVASSGEDTSINEDSGSIDLLIPAAYVQATRMQTLPGRVGLDRVGRRHSVPLSVSKSLTLPPRQAVRRESLPVEKIKARNTLLKLEEQSLLESNTTSLLSSKNSMVELSNASACERPISSENLLPDTSIASITSSTEVSRLNTLLQSGDKPGAQTSKQLTRQQTFPPLQPYARTRYMSATAEMAQCYTQILTEDNDSSGSSISGRDKSCSSAGQCCSLTNTSPLSPHDAASLQRRSNVLRGSRELLTVNMPTRRQSPTLSDTIKVKCAVNSERRHSMKTARTDDSLPVHQCKRPCSAQDTTDMFYALLMNAHSDRDTHVSDVAGGKDSDSNVEHKHQGTKSMLQEPRTTLSSKKLDRCVLTENICSRQEPRRYSIPITKHNSITINNAGRRYTAIPVLSEFDIHKVFFIGSPPDSPPRNYSVPSSNDSCSESRRSIDDPNSEILVIGGKRELDCAKGKSSKIVKLSPNAQMKENVDPRKTDDFNKSISLLRKGSQVILEAINTPEFSYCGTC